MPVIGYVSDERYLALPGAAVEITDGTRFWRTVSSASGAVDVDCPPGAYRVTLARDGYGAKHVDAVLGGEPCQFRLMSDQLYGYVWPKWARSGESAEFRVHSPAAYRLSMHRYGASVQDCGVVGWFDEHAPRATVQTTPDGDFSRTGVDWNRRGYVDPAMRQRVTAPERGGLYYFHAENEAGQFFSFPWVVAPARPVARIAVLASTNTWNAYNNFGGRSNYISPVGLPDRPVLVPRQELRRYGDSSYAENAFPDEDYPPLSFERPEPLNQVRLGERPEDPVRGRQPCHLAPAEWRLLSWLEQDGYAYDLYADAQLHDGTLDLDSYRVLVLNTHPEYWSREMYAAVHSWVFERGGRLVYLGGNGVDCEVEFVAGGTALHYLTQQGPGFFERYESRMHRTYRPTTELLGVVFTPAGAMTSAPYEVVDADHWAFAGTGLGPGDLFGQFSLHERCPGGASGHETDKRTPRTPAGATVLARGRNVDAGGAEIVHFTTPGGGEVFSVGSISWPTALPVDRAVAAITANVLDRFLG